MSSPLRRIFDKAKEKFSSAQSAGEEKKNFTEIITDEKISQELLEKILAVIDHDVRPYIESHAGHIILRGIFDGVAYVELSGTCTSCPASNVTMRYGVERILRQKFPEINAVRIWDDSPETLLKFGM